MRKRIFGRRLKRDVNERKALFRSLMHGLILHGKISTTEAKAKSIKADVDKLITIAKTRKNDAKRQLLSRLANEKTADRIINEIAPKFENRAGGYTRILRIGNRSKDGARMVFMTWTETVVASPVKEAKRKVSKVSEVSKEKKTTAKRSAKK